MGSKKGLLPARARTRAQCVVCSATKRFALGEERLSPAPILKRSLPFLTPGESRGFRVRTKKKPSCLHFVLAIKPSPQKKRRPSFHTATRSLTPGYSLRAQMGPDRLRLYIQAGNEIELSPVETREETRHIWNELPPWRAPSQKRRNSSTGCSPT